VLQDITEPYLDHHHNSQATHNWYTIYPKAHYTDLACTHSLILVNKRIATDTWSQIDLSSSNITVIQLQMERGKVLIINMYNEGSRQQGLKQAITAMRQRTCEGHNAPYTGHMIWLGDFNLQHQMWDEGRNAHLFTKQILERSQLLIDTLAEFNFQMALLKDVLMLHMLMSGIYYTRPDNVSISISLTDTIVH